MELPGPSRDSSQPMRDQKDEPQDGDPSIGDKHANPKPELTPAFPFSPKFDFDTEIERWSTESFKWNKYPRDVLPMFVADMDFESPLPICDAITERLKHRCFGYAMTQTLAIEAVQHMLSERYDWNVNSEASVFLPALVPAISIVARM